MKEHFHFIGIGGVGMSGLAHWYKADGHSVSGCDHAESKRTHELNAAGVSVSVGHHEKHLDGLNPKLDTVVSSMAIAHDEEEYKAAKRQGFRLLKRIELLADVFSKRKAIGVTGTHGKSTTTGMLATIFMAQTDPSVLLGANLSILNGNARYSQEDYLIAEVDESDPGFADLSTYIGLVTNLESDHIAQGFSERRNYHASYEDLEAATLSFAQKAKKLIYCADWLSLERLLGKLPKTRSYGLTDYADYQIQDMLLFSSGSSFTLKDPLGQLFPVKLTVPGEHNVLNAAAALSAADIAGLDLAFACRSIKDFKGVGRRWEQWANIRGTLIIDDYAHHPTEIKATLETAKQTGRRVRAILQPHRWIRTAQQWPEMADAASLADEVLVTDIYAAGESPVEGISPELIVERINLNGKPAYYYSFEDAQDYLADTVKSNDLIITLGAGNIWELARDLSARLERELSHG